MIKADMKKIELKGSIPILLSELTILCNEMKEAIVENGRSEEEAKQHIQRCFDLAFMSKKELDHETREVLLKLLLKGLV